MDRIGWAAYGVAGFLGVSVFAFMAGEETGKTLLALAYLCLGATAWWLPAEGRTRAAGKLTAFAISTALLAIVLMDGGDTRGNSAASDAASLARNEVLLKLFTAMAVGAFVTWMHGVCASAPASVKWSGWASMAGAVVAAIPMVLEVRSALGLVLIGLGVHVAATAWWGYQVGRNRALAAANALRGRGRAAGC